MTSLVEVAFKQPPGTALRSTDRDE